MKHYLYDSDLSLCILLPLLAVVSIVGDSMDSKIDESMVSMSAMSPVTLFQAVSSSSAVTTPIMKVHSESNHTLFVHYTEQTHKMMFHWLNVNPNTTNSRFVQHGWKYINFGTKIYCIPLSFTMVSKYLL